MNVHFIAIGGSAMHNLAIALHLDGHSVTGSDDEIFEPSRSRLDKYGLLPTSIGWDPTRVHDKLDAIVLGMHAREDNPELIKAQELGIPIFSYPEFIYERTKDKTRVVIGGSHGKTTITSMILHVLHRLNIDCDYMVGAQLDGFECMVRLSDAPIAILEGDEYLSSPIDRRPKFHLYKPDIAVISGIAWDHINVFPTWENYVDQFRQFIDLIEPDGTLIYFQEDETIRTLAMETKNRIGTLAYGTHPYRLLDGKTILTAEDGSEYELQVFGAHNLQNMLAALNVCLELGVDEKDFYRAIQSFTGASKRLEKLYEDGFSVAYRDFAHAPSKLQATVRAMVDQFPDRELVAVIELHTFSSLNKGFLEEYRGAMDGPWRAMVYYSPEVIAHKQLEPISQEEVKNAFGRNDLEVFTTSSTLLKTLENIDFTGRNLLIMTSGNFDGVDVPKLARKLYVNS